MPETKHVPTRDSGPLGILTPPFQWIALAAGSLIITAGLEFLQLPAARFLGPMIAAITTECCGGTIRMPRPFFHACQAVIGCMIARFLTPAILGTFLNGWPLFLGVVLAIIGACTALGWAMTRWRVLPGTTAVWGMSPGAASAIIVMASAFGADTRLVAFMQYLRVVMVATAATVVARLWMGLSGSAPPVALFPAMHWFAFAETLALIIVGGIVGKLVRLPAGIFLIPMIAGTVLHSSGLMQIELPPWLLAVSYAILGWTIGLSFTREILVHAIRTLPQMFLAILGLMLFAGALAWLLVKEFHIDPLTAYLATSPGGMDSIAIIAASGKVDVPFVMALQSVRFVIILALGPALARFVARQFPREPAAGSGPD